MNRNQSTRAPVNPKNRRTGLVLLLVAFAFAFGASRLIAAADHYGQVTFTGLAVPGATVTAVQGESQRVTVTDQMGVYRFADLADGMWTLKVEMRGFKAATREVVVTPGAPASTWELTLLPFDEITRGLPVPPPPPTRQPPTAGTGTHTDATPTRPAPLPPGPAAGSGPGAPSGFQRAGVTAPARPPGAVNAALAAPDEPPADAAAASDGFLINGSVNNGAASPFAQPAAFGNARRRVGALYNTQLGMTASSSAWDARPFSLTGQSVNVPSYNNVHVLALVQGPLRIPKILRNGPNLFVGYQRTADDTATTQSARMPTALERRGDFSQTRDPFGRSVQVVDPATGAPFSSGLIPSDRISPQAAALLGYYPLPTLDTASQYNYQAPIVSSMRQDSLQSRATQVVNQRNQVFGTASYQRTTTDTRSLFAFEDLSASSAFDMSINWNRRMSQSMQMRTRYQFTRQSADTTPYFAHRANVSGDAGITGNNQEPINWGPPSLVFSTVAGLSDQLPRSTDNLTHAAGADVFLFKGRHNVTIGGDVRRHHVDILSQQDPRGTFTFTGAATGSDFADFLLGIPSASSIAFGNADKYLRAFSYDAYITDDWRVGPSLTLTAGARWDYEAPFSEAYGRLVNLDVAPGFTGISPVLASSPAGPLTGRRFPGSLMRPDRGGVQPRLAAAWRPVPGSSLVIRGGYGVYRNTNVYQSITTLLAQQPPLSTTLSVANSQANPLTLARGFVAPAATNLNTFAVDPDFRVGYAHNWQASAQRDLPASLTVNLTYLGTRGSHLIQEFLPNTYPAGAVNPCPACPSGFAYLTSGGSSSRHAGQVQLRRRLRNGLTASVQYTLARAIDDAASFAGASLSGTVFAQNWLDLEAERGPSAFDQRHQVNASFQYTTGVGVAGGALMDGIRGTLLKGWTITGQLTSGSGLPLTPYYLRTTPGTGFTGSVRASLTGASTDPPAGYYLNPAAYAPPARGSWGDAGRNSARGPSQFSLNAGITRTFSFSARTSLDWRIDATNVLNRVTYAGVNSLVGSPQFGLPNALNQARRIQTRLTMRF
jgi:hypothetical protein